MSLWRRLAVAALPMAAASTWAIVVAPREAALAAGVGVLAVLLSVLGAAAVRFAPACIAVLLLATVFCATRVGSPSFDGGDLVVAAVEGVLLLGALEAASSVSRGRVRAGDAVAWLRVTGITLLVGMAGAATVTVVALGRQVGAAWAVAASAAGLVLLALSLRDVRRRTVDPTR